MCKNSYICSNLQGLKTATSEFDNKTEEAVPPMPMVEELQRSVKLAGREAIMALRAEITAMAKEDKSDKQKLSLLEAQSQVKLSKVQTTLYNLW